jgi:hypothetical protein
VKFNAAWLLWEPEFKQLNSMVWVRKRTIPTERPPNFNNYFFLTSLQLPLTWIGTTVIISKTGKVMFRFTLYWCCFLSLASRWKLGAKVESCISDATSSPFRYSVFVVAWPETPALREWDWQLQIETMSNIFEGDGTRIKAVAVQLIFV